MIASSLLAPFDRYPISPGAYACFGVALGFLFVLLCLIALFGPALIRAASARKKFVGGICFLLLVVMAGYL